GAYLVTGNYAPIISSLVKIATGLQTVNPDSYIKQADEIFTVDANTKTMGITHPENFIRARAIWLWHTKGAEAESQVEMMIEGKTSLDELDLFQQKTVSGQTQKLIQLILQPRWMQTAHTIALSKQYFSSQDLSGSIDINQFAELVERLHPDLKEYLAYVLYDFATTDKELEDLPLGYCFFLADGLKIQEAFGKAIKKEQKLTDKKVSNLKKQSLASYHQQELQPEPSIINS
ncbi:MAG: peptidase M48, partial [Flavisolibacter sp.]|nr:peptidase M48 [Flavisolibacter sp.]